MEPKAAASTTTKTTEIRLSWFEVYSAASQGLMRRIEALKSGYDRDPVRGAAHAWGIDIEGACAEMAVAKMLNEYWWSIGGPKRVPCDVGHGREVRQTPHESGRLIVYEKDIDHHVFFLVTGVIPEFRVVGWLVGAEAKKKKFFDKKAAIPAFFVPQRELHPMDKLPPPPSANEYVLMTEMWHRQHEGENGAAEQTEAAS